MPTGFASKRRERRCVTVALGSIDGACRHHPLTGLAGSRCDEVEVRVVVKDSKAVFLAGRRDQQVRDFAAALASLSEQALNGKRAALMGIGF